MKMEPPPTRPIQSTKHRKPFLHRLSGVWVFLVDSAFFGANAITLFSGTALICAAAFLGGATGVFLIETLLNRETGRRAFNKALLAGTLSAIPTPIAGTIYGAWVLRMAGLSKKDIPVDEPPIDVHSTASQDDNSKSH
ncbi:MAG TPA: hypothetical protein QGH16_09635 [Verrucomicrobiota bacterium]|nr:hypothetical protein [Verrucomicrobiota bacterium]